MWREHILPFCGVKEASHGFWVDRTVIQTVYENKNKATVADKCWRSSIPYTWLQTSDKSWVSLERTWSKRSSCACEHLSVVNRLTQINFQVGFLQVWRERMFFVSVSLWNFQPCLERKASAGYGEMCHSAGTNWLLRISNSCPSVREQPSSHCMCRAPGSAFLWIMSSTSSNKWKM